MRSTPEAFDVPCSHLDQIEVSELPEPIEGCEECLKIGSGWVHLRMCMTCGKIGCCDSSPNRHATAHAGESGHPIIRSAETKGLAAISRELKTLIDRARAGQLRPEEYSGGTFTISNLGMYGITSLYPILSPPQSCILGIGAALERPVVRDGAVTVGRIMSCTLSGDHRAIDGATGADADAAVRLAEAAGWPVLSEPTGNARRGPNAVSAYPLLLADEPFAARCRAELVITVGKPGLSRSLLGWIRRSDRHIVVDPHPDWADPTRSADQVVGAVPVLGVGHRWEASSRPVTNWLGVWRRAEAAATAAIDSLLDGTDRLTEPGLARELGRLAPADSLLFVGSSKPIRDFEAQLRPDLLAHVVANRGASGIDGCVSSAVGAALAWQAAGGGPAYAVLGDLAYLHDRNGLVLGPDEPRPDLCVIVVDNDGGGIFSLLPQAGIEGFERVFGTPHRADLAADAAVTGIPVAEVSTTAELAGAVKPTTGLRLVRVRTDRAAETELQHRLHAAVAAALAKLDH